MPNRQDILESSHEIHALARSLRAAADRQGADAYTSEGKRVFNGCGYLGCDLMENDETPPS